MANKKISQLTSAGSLANSDTFPIASSGATKSVTASTIKTYITSNTSLLDFGVTDGTNGQVLTTDGSGNLSFTTISGSGPTNEITNTDGMNTYSVSVSTDGVISMSTARGGIEFGAMPEIGGPQHLHIMRPAGQEGATDLYFGDDYNFIRMPGLYGVGTQSVEIGSSYNSGTVHIWRFDTNGNLKLPVGGDIVDSTGTSVLGSGTETTPSYKGFKAHYGSMYNNTSDPNGPINKLVIYKDTATPSSTIDETTNDDTFTVTGLTGSDVVAMLVVISDNVTQTPVADLKTFVEAVIDNVILDGGVEGQVNNVTDMKTAFYDNFSNFNTIIGNVKTNFEFLSVNNQFNINPSFSTGNGATFNGVSYNMDNDTLDLGSWGQGAPNTHTQGDVYVIPGNTIQDANGNYLLTPDNDVTVTVTAVSGGSIQTFTVTGTLPRPQEIWPSNFINDGGDDEYDTGNYISTDLATNISYNDGNIVSGSSDFGGGDYVVTYQDGIFGLFATGANINLIKTDGGSGFDGDGVGVTDSLYGTNGVDIGDFVFTGRTMTVTGSGEDLYIKGPDDLYLDALEDDIHIRANDDIRFRTGYNFTSDSYSYEVRVNDNGEVIFYNSTEGNDYGYIRQLQDPIDSQRVLSLDGNQKVYIRTSNTGYAWQFDTNGNLTLPSGGDIKDSSGDSVIPTVISQLTNDSGFIVATTVPASSVGAPGDVAGKIAFDGLYLYYCTDTFGGTQYTVLHDISIASSVNGVDQGYLVPDSYQLPQVGWKVYYNGETRTIDQVNSSGIPGYYVVFVDTALTIPGQATFAWGPASTTNIWKRVAWSVDTW